MKDKALAQREETLVEQKVTYTLEMDGTLYVVENVPARVNVETGEQYFSPETVERLQSIIRGQGKPVRVMETPVFDYAA
jgi:YgiT-type zinc finger domain-containing protein